MFPRHDASCRAQVVGKPFNIDMFASLMSECRAGTDNNKNNH